MILKLVKSENVVVNKYDTTLVDEVGTRRIYVVKLHGNTATKEVKIELRDFFGWDMSNNTTMIKKLYEETNIREEIEKFKREI